MTLILPAINTDRITASARRLADTVRRIVQMEENRESQTPARWDADRQVKDNTMDTHILILKCLTLLERVKLVFLILIKIKNWV